MADGFINQLEALRVRLGDPIFITSGFRCSNHNDAIGGHSRSYHLQGMAVDIAVADSKQRARIIFAAFEQGFTGIGIAPTFIHLDNRQSQALIWLY